MSKAKRKYEVCETDELGDIRVFCSDGRERAEEVADVMREDPEEVELTQNVSLLKATSGGRVAS